MGKIKASWMESQVFNERRTNRVCGVAVGRCSSIENWASVLTIPLVFIVKV